MDLIVALELRVLAVVIVGFSKEVLLEALILCISQIRQRLSRFNILHHLLQR